MDPVPSPHGALSPATRSLDIIDQWRDTTTRLAGRSADLPLAYPPIIALSACREAGGRLRVLVAAPSGASLRWETAGHPTASTGVSPSDLEGAGAEVVWTPSDPDDQIRVAVRTAGGVAIAALRARDLG